MYKDRDGLTIISMCLEHEKKGWGAPLRFAIIGFTMDHTVQLNQGPQKDVDKYIIIIFISNNNDNKG